MSTERRRLVCHAAIGLSLCLGLYSFFVAPAEKSLAEANAKEAQIEAELRAADGLRDQVPAISAALRAAGRDAEDIAVQGRPARDERNLFASIMRLAEGNHVRIDQLTPSKNPVIVAKEGTARLGDAAVGYTMLSVGTYGDLAMFLRSIRTELGYSVIRSVKLAPLADERTKSVRAIIETEHFAFEAAPLEASAMAGAPGGAP